SLALSCCACCPILLAVISDLPTLLFLDCPRGHRHLHSFPTRRSSDLSAPCCRPVTFCKSSTRTPPRSLPTSPTTKRACSGERYASTTATLPPPTSPATSWSALTAPGPSTTRRSLMSSRCRPAPKTYSNLSCRPKITCRSESTTSLTTSVAKTPATVS